MRHRSKLAFSTLILQSLTSAAQATTFVVNTGGDPISGHAMNCAAAVANSCTLRDAVAAAVSGDTIKIDVGIPIYLNSKIQLSNSLTIAGAGNRPTVIDGSGTTVIFAINSNVTATLSNLTIQNGSASDGASVYNSGTLTLANCTVSNNTGDAVFNEGTMTISKCVVEGNSGIGIKVGNGEVTVTDSTVSGNAGSGIYIPFTGMLTMTGSTVSNNGTASNVGGIVNGDGTVRIFNSTISGNQGGGVRHAWGGARTTIINCTLSDNSPSGLVGGLTTAGMLVANTIIADGCFMSIPDAGGNLDKGTTCGFGESSQSNAILNLGPLQDNGGPTWTILPEPGSAALDAGVDGVCALSEIQSVDQRGVRRPQGAHCDSGAVEAVTDRVFADNFEGTPTP